MNYYITTTLPYVNADPHLGFATEIIRADSIARTRRLLGDSVIFNTGTDEHGQKIWEKAQAASESAQTYVDRHAAAFEQLKTNFDLSYTNFIRTTEVKHIAAAQAFWQRCAANGDIYKNEYAIKYCVGCELEKTDSELEQGRCTLHPSTEIETREEENYFFRFSKYQQKLLDLYTQYPDFVVPRYRLKEISTFVESGLQDFSISRLADKMPWGVPVPGDSAHVMYVWFDALVNYIATLDWPTEEKTFAEYWGTTAQPQAIQICGKDNLRQQAAMWQAMLFSGGLPTSRHIIVNGFITSNGQKMSKSLGNVVDPLALRNQLTSLGVSPAAATDAIRFLVLKGFHPFEDSDYTWENFLELYTSHLVNGLGNLASRVLTMCRKNKISLDNNATVNQKFIKDFFLDANFETAANQQQYLEQIWQKIKSADMYIQETEPFRTIKTNPEKAKIDLLKLLSDLQNIGLVLQPFLPHSATTLLAAITDETLEIPKLFPRITAA